MSTTRTSVPVLDLPAARNRANSGEQIDYGPDREPFIEIPADPPFLCLQGHNQRPEGCPDLEHAAMAWAALMASTGDDLLPAELAAQVHGVSGDPENPMLSSCGSNALKGWVRAHPQTAALHYPELG